MPRAARARPRARPSATSSRRRKGGRGSAGIGRRLRRPVAVADAADGLDAGGAPRRLQLPPHVADVDVDEVGPPVEPEPPHVAVDLVAAEDLVLPGEEV